MTLSQCKCLNIADQSTAMGFFTFVPGCRFQEWNVVLVVCRLKRQQQQQQPSISQAPFHGKPGKEHQTRCPCLQVPSTVLLLSLTCFPKQNYRLHTAATTQIERGSPASPGQLFCHTSCFGGRSWPQRCGAELPDPSSFLAQDTRCNTMYFYLLIYFLTYLGFSAVRFVKTCTQAFIEILLASLEGCLGICSRWQFTRNNLYTI